MSEALTIVSPGPMQQTMLALRDRLRLVFPERRFQHAIMPSKITPKEWLRLTQRTPFVGLGWAQLDPIRQAGRDFIGRMHWSVYLVTQNSAGTAQLYAGDARAPGLFDLVAAAVAVLQGYTIPGVGTVTVTKAGNAFAEGWDADNTAMAAIDLAVNVSLPLADAVSGVSETVLATIGIDWIFGPLGQIEQADTISTGASL